VQYPRGNLLAVECLRRLQANGRFVARLPGCPLRQLSNWYVYSEVFDLKPTSGLSTRKTG
jgi:hypothetical protein